MNYKRRFKRELSKIEVPNIDKVLGEISKHEQPYQEQKGKLKRIALVPMVSIILCLAIISSAAITAIVKYFNADMLSKNNRQLDVVPDGYVGIYTVEDLNNIRNDLDADYILMNDIMFTDEDYLEGGICDGGWIPIGSENADPFSERYTGIFNGNGYVIKNVRINDTNVVKKSYFGIFGDTDGYFINLGIENYNLDLNFENYDTFLSDYVCVGSIAATAAFVGGCYVDGEINVSLEDCRLESENIFGIAHNQKTLCIGGICGIIDYVDSCAVYTDIFVSGGKDFSVYAGLCAGQVLSCITSYTVGAVCVDGEEYTSVNTDKVAITASEATMPVLFDNVSMEKIIETVEAYYGDEVFNANKFKAFFVRVDIVGETDFENGYERYFEANKQFGYVYTENADEWQSLYVFDRAAKTEEVREINRIISEAFGGSENFINFCIENNIKCGMLYCYSFDNESDVSQETLEGFNFDSIWTERDGRVMLDIFTN